MPERPWHLRALSMASPGVEAALGGYEYLRDVGMPWARQQAEQLISTTGMDLADPGPIKEKIKGYASALSQDKAFGEEVGQMVGSKLNQGDLAGQLAGRIDQSVGGWIQQHVPGFLQPATSMLWGKQGMCKAADNPLQDPQFGYEVGRQIASPGSPFSQGAAGQIASTAVKPELLVNTINKTQFASPVKSMLRFMMTGNLAGQGGFLEDVLGRPFMQAMRGKPLGPFLGASGEGKL